MSASAEPQPVPAAGVTETHLSLLFFVGDHVYKLKKAVAFGFIDLTRREDRQRLCHREVELNRRLAPDVYEGVADVCGPDGELLDHLVVMRRMPTDRRLATLASDGVEASELAGPLVELACQLATFHDGADRDPAQARRGASADAWLAAWAANVAEMASLVPAVFATDTLTELAAASTAWIDARRRLLSRRVDEGHIVDGHGDLQADDVYLLDDGPRVLDCLEFDDDLRRVDVADDVAFLLMDLERLGRPDLAVHLLAAYEEAAACRLPRVLLRFFMAYRALVRAKVTALRSVQRDGEDARADADRARFFASECARHLDLARPVLRLVGGAPGTGKTTLARHVADEDAAGPWGEPPLVVRSDVVRKELAGLTADQHAPSALGEGIYTDERITRTYDELATRVATALADGRSVIVDATFARSAHRDLLRAVAVAADAVLDERCCVVPPDVVAERVAARAAEGTDASDVSAEQAAVLAARFDPWPEATPVDTTLGDPLS